MKKEKKGKKMKKGKGRGREGMEIKRYKCEKRELECWRERVKEEERVKWDGKRVKQECKDCKKVHEMYVYK